jgi:hypothetical protein
MWWASVAASICIPAACFFVTRIVWSSLGIAASNLTKALTFRMQSETNAEKSGLQVEKCPSSILENVGIYANASAPPVP